MAQGTLITFEELRKNILNGTHNFASDSFKIMLVDNTVVPTAGLATPDSGDFTEVSGAGYTAGGEPLTIGINYSAGTATINHSGGAITWTKTAGGPTNIYYAIIYNTTYAGTNGDAIAFIDMTTDGGITPLDLSTSDITINLGGGTGDIYSIS